MLKRNMKKILILSNCGEGLISFRKELISTLCREYRVYICIPDKMSESRLEKLGAKVILCEFERRASNPFDELMLLLQYYKLIKQGKPDIVLTYTIKPNIYGGIVSQLLKVPYISNITGLGTSIENGGVLACLSLVLYKVGLRGANCVFFQNAANQKKFQNQHVTHGKTRVIPGSGVNLSMHPLAEYPKEEAFVKFLFIGRIMKDKGIEELLEAIKELHDSGEQVKLDIVGSFDGNYEQSIQNAEKEGYVKYYGPQLDVNPFIWGSHCVVLPSYHEGMSNVMLEAASSGRPVITTNVPGCIETFDEGVTGYGCEAGSTTSLVKAMNRIIRLSNKERAEMGLKGRIKVEKEFDRNIVIEAYFEEIKNVLCQKRDSV